jgi:uncharacterized membrane-anchored protein YhcB (DUF1043 family)
LRQVIGLAIQSRCTEATAFSFGSHKIESSMMLGQVTEIIKATESVGDNFGFAALVAFILLIGIGYFAFRMFDSWSKNQEKKTNAEIERNDRVAASQDRSYERHIEFASNTQLAVQEITRATTSISRAIDVMAATSSDKSAKIDDVHYRADQLHRAAKQTLLVLADAMFDKPDLQNKLRDIARQLEE